MKAIRNYFPALALLLAFITPRACAEVLKIGVVQTEIENSLSRNRDKLIGFIEQAKTEGCQFVIFPEGALYWSDIAVDKPTRAELDAALEQIGAKARSEKIYVLFGVGYKTTDSAPYLNKAVVYDPEGNRLLFYSKNMEVPNRFYVRGIPVNVSICSDRGYLEHSDLPCLVQDSQIIIDISGGHGGDDGRPDLRWIRYRPWASRTNAYVIVSNPVHFDSDFMGHSPWGGGSAIVRPDGSIQASRTYQKDELIVEEINTARVTRSEALRRRNHQIFKPFWDMGEKLLEGKAIDSVGDITPLTSARRDIKIAAAQIACSRSISENIRKIRSYIQSAADQDADIVVFPELAVTGNVKEDIAAANQSELDNALSEICRQADEKDIYVIVGMPYFTEGKRRNCAFVIADDGTIKTRYAQLAASEGELFVPGTETKAMWFELKGVHSIVTIGDDANMVEIADLAACRGMYLHFHIACETYASADEVLLGKQRNLLMLMYAKYGAVVNAAARGEGVPPFNRGLEARDTSRDTNSTGGMSMIVSREGGHNKPAPSGIEYYLPYQTSVAKSAGPDEEMIVATRKTEARNDMDLLRYWRNRNRKSRTQKGWYDWIKKGVMLIIADADE
jgi:predicted amidohydrolase